MTGSGKSTFHEQWVYGQRYASRKTEDISIVMLDAHGDSVSKLKRTDLAQTYFSRFVYLDAFLNKGYSPTNNPLSIPGISLENVELHAQALSLAFEELISDAKLTTYMRTVLQPCLTTLLLARTAGLSDLQSMLIKNASHRWIELGRQSPIPSHKAFFQQEFMNARYDYTKNSLYTKLQSLLNSPTFYNRVTGVNTFDLVHCVRTGKIVLINLSKGKYGEEVSASLGRFIIAQLKAIALQRASLPQHLRKPTYLVIDEADTFLGGTSLNIILKEARKYGLHLILSTQNLIDGRNQTALKRNVLNNTHVKVIGMNGYSTLSPLAKETGIPLSVLQKLDSFQFWVSSGKKRPTKLKLRNALGASSPLIKKSSRSINHRLITQTPYYKPIQQTFAESLEWIEDYPFDLQEKALQEAMPKPFYPA